jgi:hypothetical protein
MPPEICPQCGAKVPPRAKACPGCGSDEKTGWSEDARSSEVDLPDDSFDYDDFVQREFGGSKSDPKPRGISWLWWGVALVLLLVFLFAFLR